MNIKEAKYIHIIGIGGSGTSSLAQILHNSGKKVSGSDVTRNSKTKKLKLSGIKVDIGHSEKNINNKHQMVVYSPAIPPSNIEWEEAKKLKITCISYPAALGELTKDYYTIAVAGTHGKTTGTGMMSKIAIEGGLDPTVAIGSKMKELKNKNFRAGDSNYLIIEACEYRESFLNFSSNIVIITNVEYEHPDYYKTFKEYKEAFKKLVKKVPKEGLVIINKDHAANREVAASAKASVIFWSKKDKKCKFFLKDKELHFEDKKIRINPGVPGDFNVDNAALTAIAGLFLNITPKSIEKSIKNFSGTGRRMQYKRKKFFAGKFIDDYGHHPTEVEATLNAIREAHPHEKILVIYQPHQYSRTRELLNQFGPVFNNVNQVVISDIHEARDSDEDKAAISVDGLVDVIKKHNPNIKNGHGMPKTAEYIKKYHKKFDIIVTMGSGDIDNIYKML